MRHKRTRPAVVCLFVGILMAVFGLQTTSASASSPTYTVMNTSESPPDGVYFRSDAHTADAIRITGFGVYQNERVQVSCFTTGDAVGPYGNTIWYQATNVTRPTVGGQANAGYINTHYVNDGMTANHAAPGIPQCGAASPPPPPPPPHVTPCVFALKWNKLALYFSYNGQHRYLGNAWQAATNWSNLHTGLTISSWTGTQHLDIAFADVNDKSAGWYARTLLPIAANVHTTLPGSYYTPSTITINVNRYYMDPLNDVQRSTILTHELGHALGLAHTLGPDSCGVNDASVMNGTDTYLLAQTSSAPKYYDKIDLEELYNLPTG